MQYLFHKHKTTTRKAENKMARKNTNPLNLKAGDKVLLPLRKDGMELRDGNDAVWEIVSFQLDGAMATLHLVGAPASRTAGASTAALRPVK